MVYNDRAMVAPLALAVFLVLHAIFALLAEINVPALPPRKQFPAQHRSNPIFQTMDVIVKRDLQLDIGAGLCQVAVVAVCVAATDALSPGDAEAPLKGLDDLHERKDQLSKKRRNFWMVLFLLCLRLSSKKRQNLHALTALHRQSNITFL